MASDNGLTPKQRAARDIMLREFERIGNRLMANTEDQLELLKQRHDWEEMWKLAFPSEEPPAFEPTYSRRMAGVA